MASKYDSYWLGIMEEIHDGILEALNKNGVVSIDVEDITSYGKRNSWYGTIEVSPRGAKGGEMAHARALGKQIIEQDFFENLGDIIIKFKITNSLKLEINVVSKKSVKEEITQATSHNKPVLPDKLITTSKALTEKIYYLLEKSPVFDYSYESMTIPKNGIYFFYENSEKCETKGRITDRIVRVGTHRADNRFRDRIRNHYKGNKNSSVFRTHVGSAFINRNDRESININNWMKHMTPTDNDIESRIDDYFKENFRFRCISVESENERLYLEKRLIATLSHCNYPPSNRWLGHFAERREIRKSGLWDVEHTNSKSILNEQDLTLLKERINSSALSNHHLPVATNKDKNADTKQDKIICFIPCSGSKYASGNVIKPEHNLTVRDLPNTWDDLLKGRNGMQYYMDLASPETSAIELYTGSPYNVFLHHKEELVELIQSHRLRLIVISAGYGIVDALEPIHDYDAMMKGGVATNWKNANLTNVIADLLLQEQPTRVYGFFAGVSYWQTSSSSYRYFFTEGVKTALSKGLDTELTGCFYRMEGRGVKAILGSLGRTFVELLKSDFDDTYVENIYKNCRRDGNITIGFDEITI